MSCKKKNALKLFTSTIYERKLRRVELFPWWITLLYRIYKEYTVLYNVTGKCCPVEPKSNMIFLNKKWRVSKILSEWLINFSWGKKNICFIFFPLFRKKNKTLFANLSEWVTPKLIPEKKNGTFGNTLLQKTWCRILNLPRIINPC